MKSRVNNLECKMYDLLDSYGIDLQSKGGRALVCCATAAYDDPTRSIGSLCEAYADFTQTNVWAVHANMVYACRRAQSGLTPGKLIRRVVAEVGGSAD